MAQLKICDRCKKQIAEENEIGVVIGISKYRADRGYIRPSKKLLEEAKKEMPELEYFPVEFKAIPKGEFDLCSSCFEEFMALPASPSSPGREKK